MSESTNQLLAALHRQKLASRTSQGTNPLPPKFSDAVASVAELVSGAGDPVHVKEAFNELALRNRALLDNPEASAEALAAQVQLLERLFLRYVQRAEACQKAEHRHLAMRTALACQRQAMAALAALYQLRHAPASA